MLPGCAQSQALSTNPSLGEIHVNLDILKFEAEDILSVSTFELDGLFGVEIELSPHLGPGLTELTKDKVGFQIELLLCGKWMSRARIAEPITTAAITITSGTKEKVDAIAAAFLRPPCAKV